MATPSAQSVDHDDHVDTSKRPENDTSDGESDNSDEEEEQTEWLATTREKRSTAGNRLSSLLQQAAAEDDDLELLFAEDEDDAGFEDAEEDGSDVQMDSSDDDDDQGPTAGAEELEGEKELQQQARAERQSKKRKANDGIPKMFRKKVKIDPTAPPKAPPPRPKKKSERASWIPSAEEAPTRASARSTTKLSKEQLYIQMLEREERRLRQLEIMEKAAERKAAEKPKEMTQEDRLKEAERVEMKNKSSLNSWEEAEKIREEEQRAKLAALHDRKLEGPFITWWSGMAEWVGGKLKRVGKNHVIEEKVKGTYTKKKKQDDMQEDVMMVSAPPTPATIGTPVNTQLPSQGVVSTQGTPSHEATLNPKPTPPALTTIQTEALVKTETTATPLMISSGPPQASMSTPLAPPLPTPTVLDGSAPLPGFYNPPTDSPAPPAPQSFNPPPPRLIPSQTTPFAFTPIKPPPTIELPPVIEHGTYNCLILENFDEDKIKSKDIQSQVLFHRKVGKAQSRSIPSFQIFFSLYILPSTLLLSLIHI